ncbi:hypothetical protein ES332_A11G349300v1 [Gossypium tomentosum]|uniref:Uncharacterized protein n=1 Tax=Gossypium tomentosum TaxID=34277 RepID=A0A5D2NN11_GOSTO|nr:hypothetical protein ES332_A11G349300v1 [Gossypium tomentosum]
MDQKRVHDFLLDIRVMPIALLTGFGRRRKPKSNSSSRLEVRYILEARERTRVKLDLTFGLKLGVEPTV